jgi:hypothetical protein
MKQLLPFLCFQLAHLSSGATGCPVAQIRILQVSRYPGKKAARNEPQTWVARCGQQRYYCTFWFDGPGRVVCATTLSEKAVP